MSDNPTNTSEDIHLVLLELASHYGWKEQLLAATPQRGGHLHHTYRARWGSDAANVEYIHQRINVDIFQDVAGLMGNIERVTTHLRKKIATNSASEDFKTLELIHTKDGATFVKSKAGDFWRTYRYIPNTESFDVCPSAEIAYRAARMYGEFQKLLLDIDAAQLTITIPNFDNVPWRYEKLAAAVRADPRQRVKNIQAELLFSESQRSEAHLFQSLRTDARGRMRVAHYDTKLNNILFNSATKHACCVVDLDTCMPGCLIYDFGDLVRNAAINAPEDAKDIAKIKFRADFFDAMARGYLENARTFLTTAELAALPRIPRLNALNLGVRFLTDYIEGDHYFGGHYPDHNLDRARVQFEIVQLFDRNREAMEESVKRYRGKENLPAN